jgi:hypothetical protein
VLNDDPQVPPIHVTSREMFRSNSSISKFTVKEDQLTNPLPVAIGPLDMTNAFYAAGERQETHEFTIALFNFVSHLSIHYHKFCQFQK